jgi:hyperosmotically inducible protein
MKTSVFALFAMGTIACGGSDRPPQDPSSTTVTAAPVESSPPMPGPTGRSMQSDQPAAMEPSTAASIPAPGGGAPATWPAPTPMTDKSAMSPSSTTPNSSMPSSSAPDSATPSSSTPGRARSADQTSSPPPVATPSASDRHDKTATDQGNDEADRKTTAAIRRAVVGDKELSVRAKNIVIVTAGGKVTLRGQVKSSQERAAIERKARETPGVVEVDNQLEVKE